MYRTFVAVIFLGVVSSASVQKRAEDKYGGGGTAPIAPSYSPVAAAPSYGTNGVSAVAGSPSYSPGAAGADSGNLYYYYYPVTGMQPGPAAPGYPSYPAPSYPMQPTTSNPLFDFFGFGNIDFNSLIIPLLLIGGILLLLPAILGCDLQSAVCTIPLPTGGFGLGRKRRDIDGHDGPVTLQENVNRAFNMYMAAMEGDICFKRIACELGGLMGEVKGKTSFFSLMDAVVPDHLRDSMKAFKTGAITDQSKCQIYKCGSKRWLGE